MAYNNSPTPVTANGLSAVFGALGLEDNDYTFPLTYGQEPIFDALAQLLGDHNDDMMEAEAVFVEKQTSAHITRYYLSEGGRLEKVQGKAAAGYGKAVGAWDVAYPLEGWGRAIGGDRVQWAYMSSGMFGRHVHNVLVSDRNTRRFEMLKAVFNNGGGGPRPFLDPNWSTLNIQPLANGDTTWYPPTVGGEDPVQSNHYLASGFLTANISDTNDPISPMVDLLESHFGIPTGGSEIVLFLNKAEMPKVQAMTLFHAVEYRFQQLGVNITQAVDTPERVPGRTLGEFGGKCAIQRWDWIPAGYMFAVHLLAAKPLVRRVDPPETGLAPGLQLIQQSINQPFWDSRWEHRFGYGCGNRLNGVVMQLTTNATYTTPTQFQ